MWARPAEQRPATPCTEVALGQGLDRCYAVLRDKHGAEQYPVMPTLDITGIEDARLLAPGAPTRRTATSPPARSCRTTSARSPTRAD